MVWIILCAISYIGIFVIFKLIDVKGAPLLNCIVVNYLTATILGFAIFGSFPVAHIVEANWFPIGILLGFLFIVTFLLVGISSSKTGIVITTVASKMSLVVPMLFYIIMYGEPVSAVKIVAILLAVASVILCTYKPSKEKTKSDIWKFLLPAIIFIAMGANDSLVIYSRERFGISDDAALFTATLFGISLLCGILYSIVKKGTLRKFLTFKTWWLGILLGIIALRHLQHINNTAFHSHRRDILQGKTNPAECRRRNMRNSHNHTSGLFGNVVFDMHFFFVISEK